MASSVFSRTKSATSMMMRSSGFGVSFKSFAFVVGRLRSLSYIHRGSGARFGHVLFMIVMSDELGCSLNLHLFFSGIDWLVFLSILDNQLGLLLLLLLDRLGRRLANGLHGRSDLFDGLFWNISGINSWLLNRLLNWSNWCLRSRHWLLRAFNWFGGGLRLRLLMSSPMMAMTMVSESWVTSSVVMPPRVMMSPRMMRASETFTLLGSFLRLALLMTETVRTSEAMTTTSSSFASRLLILRSNVACMFWSAVVSPASHSLMMSKPHSPIFMAFSRRSLRLILRLLFLRASSEHLLSSSNEVGFNINLNLIVASGCSGRSTGRYRSSGFETARETAMSKVMRESLVLMLMVTPSVSGMLHSGAN